jgi:hypothetical protein
MNAFNKIIFEFKLKIKFKQRLKKYDLVKLNEKYILLI